MKVLSISILKNYNNKSIFLSHKEDLKHINFFFRSSAREFLKFAIKEIYSRTELMKPKTVYHENYYVHAFQISPKGMGAVMVTDDEYIPRVAFSVIKKCFDEFINEMNFIKKDLTKIEKDTNIRSPFLEKMIKDAQDPCKVDHIEKIKHQMDDTIESLQESIETILERGSKIDDLVAKTEDLSDASKAFYKEAKKQNDCCTIC